MIHCYAVVEPSGALRIVLPMPTPSLNEWNGKRWFSKARIKQVWERAIAILLMDMNLAVPETRKRVSIIRYGKRDLDHDNLWAGCKPVLDALKGARVIHDDAPKWLDLHVSQQRPAKGEPPHTVITVEEAAQLAPGATSVGGPVVVAVPNRRAP